MAKASLGRIILGSASPRRRELLKEHGYDFEVVPADVEEIAHPHLTPGEIVLCNARTKARAVARLHRESIVIGVDTLVAFENEIFGKPSDMEAARTMLRRLNGKAHHVYSGLWIVHLDSGQERGAVEISSVRFRTLTHPEIEAYLARIAPLDKAGGYAAQNDGGEFIAGVDGSFSNVIGLPMEALERELAAWK